MRTTLSLTLFLLLLLVSFNSCKKEPVEDLTPPTIITQDPDPPIIVDPDAGVNLFIVSQNYLLRMINFALTTALLTPEMHGIAGDPNVETRTCPTVTSATGSPNTLSIDFGTNCSFNNTVGGTPDIISGLITLEAFGDITDPSTNTFLRFDELKINNTLIRFVPGNPTQADWIKLQFSGNPATNTFTYDAFIDGTVPTGADPAFDRSQFQIVDCLTGDSCAIYPSYSGTTAFNFMFTDPSNPNNPPEFTYNSLVNGCYEININPLTLFYFDGNGVLQEDYNVFNGGTNDPLLYKPLCKWVFGGKLSYDDIPSPNGFNYTDAIDNPFRNICYGSDVNGNEMNVCDRYVKVTECGAFSGNQCVVGADTTIVACPL